jgi:arsenate reductase
MQAVTIYHNPRCSKSRQTLKLLQEHGIEPRIIEYLKDPPDEHTLARILGMLDRAPIDLMRKNEKVFGELGLEEKKDDPNALIKAMIKHPILMERPIVIKGDEARIGRPPEDVLEIL